MRIFESRALLSLAALLVTASAVASAGADGPRRITATVSDRLGFVDGGSFVNVRENDVKGDRLSLPALGVRHLQILEADIDFRAGRAGTVEVQARDFLVDGSRTLDRPAFFNGSTLAGGQTIQTNPIWTSLGVYYKRRWAPAALRGGDMTALAGLEYVSLNFRLNGGHAAVAAGSAGTETKEGFHVQELPLPTLGLSARRPIAGPLSVEASVSGNWINNWNSLRKEGGTIYLSQRRLEGAVTARLADDGRFRRLHPFVGVFGYLFRQHEQSREDDNLISVATAGPYGGVDYEF